MGGLERGLLVTSACGSCLFRWIGRLASSDTLAGGRGGRMGGKRFPDTAQKKVSGRETSPPLLETLVYPTQGDVAIAGGETIPIRFLSSTSIHFKLEATGGGLDLHAFLGMKGAMRRGSVIINLILQRRR
jgi:hypothetical protein